ncbi:MAG: hypothetical protein ACR2QK_25275 [Acidimicrobiales bacterium]
MPRKLGPVWSEDQVQAGQRTTEAWRRYFSESDQAGGNRGSGLSAGGDEARIADVRRRHEQDLLRRAGVVGVSTGIRTRDGRPTGERCLVVWVERKRRPEDLGPEELLPTVLDGVPVDVVETGSIEAL